MIDTEKVITLKAVREAIEKVNEERQKKKLKKSVRAQLEQAYLTLYKIENNIILKDMDDMIKTLKEDNKKLRELIKDMKEKTKELNKVVKIINKASQAAGKLVKVVTKAASAGLL